MENECSFNDCNGELNANNLGWDNKNIIKSNKIDERRRKEFNNHQLKLANERAKQLGVLDETV